jgi:Flp pilus assembly protein TadG
VIGMVGRRSGSTARRGRSRGQTLVEFALVFPIMVLLLMVLVDFGRVIFAQNAVTEASREGARVGSVGAALTQAQYDAIRNAALQLAPGTDLVAANISGASGACTPADTTSPTKCFYPGGIAGGQPIVVNISVTVPLLTPVISNIVGGSITVKAQSVGRIQ